MVLVVVALVLLVVAIVLLLQQFLQQRLRWVPELVFVIYDVCVTCPRQFLSLDLVVVIVVFFWQSWLALACL